MDHDRIPHKKKKQLYSAKVIILWIDIDVNELLYTLLEESKGCLERKLAEWSQKGLGR